MSLVRTRVVAVVAVALTGFGGAAAVDALARPAVAVADGFGPGDGLTRYVLTASAGPATPEFLAALDAVEGVDSAQRLDDGSALVATTGMPPQRLRSLPGVATVDFSPSVPVQGTVSDPYWSSYGWNLENTGSNAYLQTARADADVDAPDAWTTSTGAGVVVAVVDTGYDSDHPDLAGALWTNPAQPCGAADTDGNGLAGDCHGWNFTTNSPDVDNGAQGTHGTSVAGVIAARAGNGQGSAGVAPGVTVMPLVVGSGESINVDLGAQAIRYAADHGATVVNASWGGQTTGAALDRLRAAVAYAEAKGVLITAAAGNDAGDRDRSILYPASLTDDNVITVGSSTAVDTVSDSSAYGATSVDLFAPGNLVFTTWNDGGYRLVSGTSIAAPEVAAAVALYRSAMPTATAAELKAALLGDVDPIAAFAGRALSEGRLDVGRLVPGSDVSYRFSGTSGPAGILQPQVAVSAPDAAGDWSVTVGLGMSLSGEVWALADTAISLDGVSRTTDDAGEATFDLGTLPTVDQRVLTPTVDLTAGRYVLAIQLHRDGTAVGRTYAAPLLVGQPGPASAGPSAGGTAPDSGTTAPGDAAPGGTTPGDDATGGTTPGNDSPGSDGTGSQPGTGSGTDDPAAGGTAPGTPGAPGADALPDPSTGGGPTAPSEGSSAGGGADGGDAGDGQTPAGGDTPGSGSTPEPAGTPAPDTSSDPLPGSGAGSSNVGSAPGAGGSTSYPGVGDFLVTRISPSTVSTAGGTEVTITGTGITAGPRVLVGPNQSARVLRSSSTSVTFSAPALVAGVYDVTLFSAGGAQSSLLAGGLTYVAPAAAGGSGPSAGDGSSSDGASPAAPGTGDSGSGDSGSGGTTPGAGGGSGPTPASGVGPAGQRLVRTAKYASLGAGFWSLDCRTSCRGVLV